MTPQLQPKPERGAIDPSLSGIKYLMVALLRQAMEDYTQDEALADARRRKPKSGTRINGHDYTADAVRDRFINKHRAEAWLRSDSREGIFDFCSICGTLGLSESWTRALIGM